jgi:hypothetical protein
LGIVLSDNNTESPVWERVSKIDLDNHIVILDDAASGEDDVQSIEKALPDIVDARFAGSIPPWRVVVLPLSPKNGMPRCFIVLAMSHSIGDGGAGLAFHQTFLEALCRSPGRDDNFTVVVAARQLPEPLDTPEKLPISPEFMRSVTNSSVVDAGTWTGSRVFSEEGQGLCTKIRVLEVHSDMVDAALRISRSQNTKLTPTLHQLVVRALSKAIKDENITNFASVTAIDLRRASHVNLDWGIFVSGLATSHDRVVTGGPVSDEMWESARRMTRRLSEVASTLDNQIIGMLRFIPNQRDSLLSKIGTPREGSYSLSNMLAVDGGKTDDSCRIAKMVVATSAAVPSPPLSICLVSVKGGSLVCTLSWQPGAFGCPVEDEASFVDELCASLEADFASLGVVARL